MIKFKKNELKETTEDIIVRCLKTFIQTMIGCIGTSTMFSEINFLTTLNVCVFSTFMCFLMNVYKYLTTKVGDEND